MPLLMTTGYGAPPAGVNWWSGNRFMMPGLLMPEPPPAAPAPAPQQPSLDARDWVPNAALWVESGGGEPAMRESGLGGAKSYSIPASSALRELTGFGRDRTWGQTALGLGLSAIPGAIPGLGTLVSAAFGDLSPRPTAQLDLGKIGAIAQREAEERLAAGEPGISVPGGGFNANDYTSYGVLGAPAGQTGYGGFSNPANYSGQSEADRAGSYSGGGYDKGGYDKGGGHEAGHDKGLYAKGGTIGGRGLLAFDPPGEDDVVIGAQRGEGVVTKAAMRRHPGLLAAWNRGDTREMRSLLRVDADRRRRSRPCGC